MRTKRDTEVTSMEEDEEPQNSCGSDDSHSESISSRDEEEALFALIEHRTKEVDHLRTSVTYYQSQLEQAERRLQESVAKLARIRRQAIEKQCNSSMPSPKKVKVEHRSISPIKTNECSTLHLPKSKPQPKTMTETGTGVPYSPSDRCIKEKRNESHKAPLECNETKSQAVDSEMKAERREKDGLVAMVQSCTSASMIQCSGSTYISSQHKRKLRSLALCPVSDKIFITSALDGMVHLWQLQTKGSGATCLSSTNCLSPKKSRWPEDIAWHPEGNRILAVYSADGGDNQISIIDFDKSQSDHVTFLDEKPHVKGVINSITFMPWNDAYFATGGSDHAVIFWAENNGDKVWEPKILHRNLHSSAVMGVAAMQHKQVVVSAGADKRIIGYDVLAGRADYKHQLERKCMSVVPNPCDFNLFMIQTGTPERQIRLFDMRVRGCELQGFGWKQESSEQQSALISQAWSPDGLYISSGSADPMIHIFDIRYNCDKPS